MVSGSYRPVTFRLTDVGYVLRPAESCQWRLARYAITASPSFLLRTRPTATSVSTICGRRECPGATSSPDCHLCVNSSSRISGRGLRLY